MTLVYNQLGYHTTNSLLSLARTNGQQRIRQENIDKIGKFVTVLNALQISGYFPLIGAYIGYKHVYYNIAISKDSLSVRVMQVIRGILEILCLGILFLIPDLVVSLHRHVCAATPDEQTV